MARPLAQRLAIKPGCRVLTVNAPPDYDPGPLPDRASLERNPEPGVGYDVVHLFVADRSALDEHAAGALAAVRAGGALWCSYPKKSGPLRSDISRDEGWEPVERAGWVPVSQISVDDTWSALRFKPADDVRYTPGSSRHRAPQQGRSTRPGGNG